jgi:hypothetical protein
MFFLRLRVGILLAIILVICTCIDPYTPNLKGYDSLLTVDALITDSNTSCTVKLTKTMQNQNDIPPAVSDASVYLTDDAGNSNTLNNEGGGIYKTDTKEFTGIVGRTYVLHINTSDGNEYESEPGMMQSVSDIDSIYFEKDQQLINNATQSLDGISIYLDSKGGNNQYYRWSYEETWKFRLPLTKTWNYIKKPFNPDSPILSPIANVKVFCWKNRKSSEIITRSANSGSSPGIILKQPVVFIGTDQSDRLIIQYSILITQYSISKKEYDFWNNLQQINEIGGDIFAKQPYTVISNIKNIHNSNERVLGYFQVSAVKQRRKTIAYNDIIAMNLPLYNYPCQRFTKDRSDVPTGPGSPPPTWDELYSLYCETSDYTFVEPLFYSGTLDIEKLVFARPECSNCQLTGTSVKPDFWVDLN